MSLRLGSQEIQSYIKVSVREPKYQSKTVNPATTDLNILPDDTYDGLTSVLVKAMPAGSLKSLTVDKAGLISYGIESDGYLTSQDLTFQLPVKSEETFIPTTTDQYITFGKYITGTQTIKGDSNLKAENIKEGISLFGIDGTCKIGLFPTGNLDITANGEYPVENLSTVNVNVPIPDGYIIPSGSLTITENGSKDVTNYALVDVNVFIPETMTKLITPTTRLQTINPDEGKVFSSVQVKGVDNSIDTNIKAENIKSGVSILGVSGTYGGDLFKQLVEGTLKTITADTLAGITKIAASGFESCNITSLEIPSTIVSIGSDAFYDSSIKTLVIPETLKSIGITAFGDNISLTSLIIKGSTVISRSAFSGCNGLTDLIIESSPTLELNSFEGCSKLTSLTIKGTPIFTGAPFDSYISKIYITNIESWLNIKAIEALMATGSIYKELYLNGTLITNLVIPDSTVSIYDFAFRGLSKITKLTIPVSVTSIGRGSFYQCDGLTNITYTGTKAQWNAITLGENWAGDTIKTITCTDGTITL